MFSAPIAGPLLASNWPTEAQKAAWDAEVTPANYDPATTNPWGLHPRLLPQRVEARPDLVPGDIHVDATARYLYHIEPGGTAMRYGVAIGEGGLYEPGTYTIRRKVRWPHWKPTQNMIRREPEAYAQYEDGMEPGPKMRSVRGLSIFISVIATPIFGSTAHPTHALSARARVPDVCAWSCPISTTSTSRSKPV